MSLLDKIVGAIRGHRLAVLGERSVGKTHLQMFLRERRIPANYSQTLGKPSLTPGRAHLFAVEDMTGRASRAKVAFKAGHDVPGAAEAVEAWRAVLSEATVLLYLFRADRVFARDSDHRKRILDDASVISRIVTEERISLKAAALVGTHYDLVSGYRGPTQGTAFYPFHAAIAESPTIQDSQRLIGATREGRRTAQPALVVGSMKDVQATQELAYRLFAQELHL